MTDVFDGAKRAALAVVLSYLVSFTMAGIWYFAKGGRLKDPRRQLKPLLASALPITGMRTSNSLVNSAISLLLPARLIAAGFTSSEAMSEIGVATGMMHARTLHSRHAHRLARPRARARARGKFLPRSA